MPKKINTPLIRESSEGNIISISIFRQGLETPRKTVKLHCYGMAHVITTSRGNSRILEIVGVEPLCQALTRGYQLAMQTAREIAREDEFPILFEGKSGKKESLDSKRFLGFLADYFRSEYHISY